MTIYPAIDLKEGCAVRLSKGEMSSATIYSKEPWEFAKQFEDMGAKWLHIVDLDGAFAGHPKNFTVIEKIRASTSLHIQIGGGIRDEKRLQEYKQAGINRLILGSIALKNPDFVKEMAKNYPIAVGIDAKDGYVAVEGWAEVSTMKAVDLAIEFAHAGVEAIIATDISKDGMLSGVNFDFTLSLQESSKLPIIASGGVKDISDIQQALEKNVSGIIVGKAFYEKKIDLKEAFKLL